MSDNKIKTAEGKCPLNLIPKAALAGPARAFQFGDSQYGPGNFVQATPEDGAIERYLGAVERHLRQLQDLGGRYGRANVASRDAASGLPHLDHAIASLLMLRCILVKSGALVEDPGQPQTNVVRNVLRETLEDAERLKRVRESQERMRQEFLAFFRGAK